jgi:hypothetical protein
VAVIFFKEFGQNEQFLLRTFQPNFSLFGKAVFEDNLEINSETW